jgi:hypothetical protein
MSERVPAAIAAASSIIIVAYACATLPSTSPSPGRPQPATTTQTPTGQQPPPSGPSGFGSRLPISDSARRVRDSITSVRRDSSAANVLRQIAGKENMPAESVFKNIKIFQGVPAGRLVNIMNRGFGRSLGVGCGFCHVPGKFESDDKVEKQTARLMFAMVQTINKDYLSKLQNDRDGPPTASCFTCHRGNPRPMSQEGPPGPRPSAAPGSSE